MPEATRRTADQLALKLFAQLRHRTLADRVLVRDAVREELMRRDAHGRDLVPERQAMAVGSLQDYEAEEGKPPSRKAYDDWFETQPRDRGLMSSNQIRGAFRGRWSQAVEAAGQPISAGVRSRRLLANGPRLTREQLLRILCACREEHPGQAIYFENQYLPWARREQTAQPLRFAVVPVSRAPFLREFGSWPNALRAASCPVDPCQEQHDGVDDGLILHWVGLLAAEAAPTRLTSTHYRERRRELVNEARERGASVTIPGNTVIARRFGPWDAVLQAAEVWVTSDKTTWSRARRGPNFTAEEIDRLLKLLADEKGCDVSSTAYDQWRAERRSDASDMRLPSAATLMKHCGGTWSEVRSRMMGIGAEPIDPRRRPRRHGGTSVRASASDGADR